MSSQAEAILARYDELLPLLRDFGPKMEALIHDLLTGRALLVSAVTHRIKARNSFALKLGRPDKNYKTLFDVTDVVGLRVITYYEDEVDEVASLVEDEFEIDQANSVDKGLLLDPDRFGYDSLHYVCQLKTERSNLPEWKRFAEIPSEIQIRSLLQHAWAENEHRGYKGEVQVPRSLRRRFSRVAALLEIADAEFVSSRDELRQAVEDVPEEVAIDRESLWVFIKTSDLIQTLDARIAKALSLNLTAATKQYADHQAAQLRYLGLRTVADVHRALNNRQEFVFAFATEWFQHYRDKYREPERRDEPLRRGISLFYLGYILVAERNSAEEIARYLPTHVRPRQPEQAQEEAQELAHQILELYRQLKISG